MMQNITSRLMLTKLQSYDGYYKEMDRQTAGLERNPRTTGCILRGSHAGLTSCKPACQGSR